MIALAADLPLLRVGDDDLVPLEYAWVEAQLRGLAANAGHNEWLGAQPVAAGLISYLRYSYPATAVTLDFLNDKLRPALAQIGFPDIALACHLSPPAVTLDLCELARQSDHLWLVFFLNLKTRLQSLREAGVTEIRLANARRASQFLAAARQWSPKAHALHTEVMVLCRHFAGPAVQLVSL